MNLDQKLIEKEKKNAAIEAVKHVEANFIVGLGSGTTVAYAIKELGRMTRLQALHVMGVPTSHQAFMLAVQSGIQITTLEEHPTLDLTIDGADQIDTELNLIKGMGGALTREKTVAYASKRNIIVADETKKVKVLGENNHPVPIEVIPFATKIVMQKIAGIGGKPVLREGDGKVGPVITDNGNFIVDAFFGPIHEPSRLETKLKSLPGIVENGLFIETAETVYVGKSLGVEKLKRH